MAKVQNTFLKSKMNKDLDARLLPNGEYRDALNVQVSRSEGAEVGALENVLGNKEILNFQTLTSVTGLKCIGQLADEINNTVYLYLTDNTGQAYVPTGAGSNHFIISHNTLSNQTFILVKGAFLNFSTLNPIYGVNILEGLLFWPDNRNQPRKIDTTLANNDITNLNPIYYQTEDQISVAKYNPYRSIELYQESVEAPTKYETTMKDVSSLYLPNGGSALAQGAQTGATININSLEGQINLASGPYTTGSEVWLQDTSGNLVDTNRTVTAFTAATAFTASGSITVTDGQVIVFNPNPYYDSSFSGDEDFLEDKFVRFSYRFKFEGNEYSIFAPFTQTAFIPKQDGYFMYTTSPNPEKDDQGDSYRSTVVYFMENKVNSIGLRIPLPFTNYSLADGLKIKEVDILYKESDGISVKVVDTISMKTIAESSAICTTSSAQSSVSIINVDSVQGGISIGQRVSGVGIPDNTFITAPGFTPTDPSNPIAGTIKISNTVTVDDDILITIGDPDYYDYSYKSTKPFKTLPEAELIRVYDKVPVKALAQEVSGNRVIYGNYQNKQTPPSSLNYNVACTEKADFSISEATLTYNAGATTSNAITVTIDKVQGSGLFAGAIITSNTYGVSIPPNTEIASTTSNTAGSTSNLTLTNAITLPAGTVTIIAQPGGSIEDSTGIIEYPSSSVKTNRNYQIGFVLSDRYGRQSSVILSNNTETIEVAGVSYSGSTLYSPYIPSGVDQDTWRGNSLKILLNEIVTGGSAGIYNGDTTSSEYNPLGWYSYKIVVKQTEQDYYNVYLPGIMAAYPDNTTLELGKTSHTVLINDNINKVPRDLAEVGPDQKQFRSSVQLFGRVENTPIAITSTNFGDSNTQYYPGQDSDTVSTISTMEDLFEIPSPIGNFTQFYSYDSNPLIGRISTNKQIGQIATTNTPDGIQYLAVYETEPVESLLDIFWETSSAGLIQDLNDAVLNASVGVNDLAGWNTNPFLESLGPAPQDVLTSTLTIVDNFGVTLTGTLVLEDVVNGGGESVNVGSGAYFTLQDTGSGNGPWRVRTTTAYYNSIYYSSNEDFQNFTFTFTATANNLSTTIQKQANLGNVEPEIFQINGIGVANPTSYGPLYVNSTTSPIALIDGVNGANLSSLKWRDLDFSIQSQVNSSGVSVDYFSLSQEEQLNTYLRATLVNDYINNIPLDIYTIVIRLQDAGDSHTLTLTVDLRLAIPQNFIFNRTFEYDDPSGDPELYPFTVIKIDNTVPGATLAQQGWYLFNPGWFTLYNPCNGAPGYASSGLVQYAGGNFITLPLTQPDEAGNQCRTSVGAGEAVWYFSSTSQNAVEDLMRQDNPDLPNTGGTISNGFNCAGSDPAVPANPDVTNILFQVI